MNILFLFLLYACPSTEEKGLEITENKEKRKPINDSSEKPCDNSDSDEESSDNLDPKEPCNSSDSNEELDDSSDSNEELDDSSDSNEELDDSSDSNEELDDSSDSNEELDDSSDSNEELDDSSDSNEEPSDDLEKESKVVKYPPPLDKKKATSYFDLDDTGSNFILYYDSINKDNPSYLNNYYHGEDEVKDTYLPWILKNPGKKPEEAVPTNQRYWVQALGVKTSEDSRIKRTKLTKQKLFLVKIALTKNVNIKLKQKKNDHPDVFKSHCDIAKEANLSISGTFFGPSDEDNKNAPLIAFKGEEEYLQPFLGTDDINLQDLYRDSYGVFSISKEGSVLITPFKKFEKKKEQESIRLYFPQSQYLVGGPLLVEDSEIVFTKEKFKENRFRFSGQNAGVIVPGMFVHANDLNQRTMVIIREQEDHQELIFIYLAGRDFKGDAIGMDLAQMAVLAKNLGANFALNLDGGGTSALVWKPVGESKAYHPKIRGLSDSLPLLNNYIQVFLGTSQNSKKTNIGEKGFEECPGNLFW